MKLLALISMGVAASYWYKTIKDSKPTLLKPTFDEIVKNRGGSGNLNNTYK
ncbi:hypothetical protein PWJ64_18220 [Acinetobacter nosocomialis]|uniref:hypothetical protein n=1 Tax=Acinetobacter nosocomialis TaxID=106654 RepID=UPI00237C7A95|nr:hypothetical protein [Acinetobacter nosocomialis]MDE1708567.1 hypothetical protein [Acinetobacter nosocomialis]